MFIVRCMHTCNDILLLPYGILYKIIAQQGTLTPFSGRRTHNANYTQDITRLSVTAQAGFYLIFILQYFCFIRRRQVLIHLPQFRVRHTRVFFKAWWRYGILNPVLIRSRTINAFRSMLLRNIKIFLFLYAPMSIYNYYS